MDTMPRCVRLDRNSGDSPELRAGHQLIFSDQKKLTPPCATFQKRPGPGSENINLGFRLVRDALLQAISICATIFAAIDVAVRV